MDCGKVEGLSPSSVRKLTHEEQAPEGDRKLTQEENPREDRRDWMLERKYFLELDQQLGLIP